MIIQKRSAILLFTLLTAITLVIAACGDDDSAEAPEHPVVRLKVGDQTYEEDVYSYCWPETADNVVCDLNAAALAESAEITNVAEGDEIRFVIEGDAGKPDKFTATLLDDQGGASQDLGTETEALYTTQLADGQHDIQVDVEYADIEGQAAYVSYVFRLSVGEAAVAVVPSPTSTEEPTEEPTATPTLTPEPPATLTPTPEPTATPTQEPTETPTEASTEMEIGTPTAVDTETATPSPPALTMDVTPTPTMMATGDLGEKSISGTVRVDAGGTPVAAAGVEVSYSHSSMARPERASAGGATTDANGQYTFSPIFLHDTDQIILSVEVPGYEPQSVRRTGYETWTSPVFDFVLAPVTAITPTVAAPTTAPSPTPSLTPPDVSTQPLLGDIPTLIISFAGKEYLPLGYEYCERQGDGGRICVEWPAAGAVHQRINFLRGSAAQIKITGTRPVEVQIEYLSDTGVPTGQPETQPGDNTILFTIAAEPGTYILTIRVVWTDKDTAYFFRVSVTD